MSDSNLPANPDDDASNQDPSSASAEQAALEDAVENEQAPAAADPWAEETAADEPGATTIPFWLMGSVLVLAVAGIVVLLLQNRNLQTRLEQATGKNAATEPVSPKLLRITGEIDGTGVFHFTERTVFYEHRNWGEPAAMTFDGAPWDDLGITPKGWQETGPKLDLSRAYIVSRKGRDVISLEHTDSGFDLYLADSHGGSDSYEVTISLPMKR